MAMRYVLRGKFSVSRRSRGEIGNQNKSWRERHGIGEEGDDESI